MVRSPSAGKIGAAHWLAGRSVAGRPRTVPGFATNSSCSPNNQSGKLVGWTSAASAPAAHTTGARGLRFGVTPPRSDATLSNSSKPLLYLSGVGQDVDTHDERACDANDRQQVSSGQPGSEVMWSRTRSCSLRRQSTPSRFADLSRAGSQVSGTGRPPSPQHSQTLPGTPGTA